MCDTTFQLTADISLKFLTLHLTCRNDVFFSCKAVIYMLGILRIAKWWVRVVIVGYIINRYCFRHILGIILFISLEVRYFPFIYSDHCYSNFGNKFWWKPKKKIKNGQSREKARFHADWLLFKKWNSYR